MTEIATHSPDTRETGAMVAAIKIRSVTAKVRNVPESRENACDGTSKIIALLLSCHLFPVSGRWIVTGRTAGWRGGVGQD